jgi:glycosyltransferase involved in cell wall biosynthesis
MNNIRTAVKAAWRKMGYSRSSSDYWPATSVIFDEQWYLHSYDDLTGVDPRKHYWEWGQKEGRRPSLHFDPAWYGMHRPDVPTSIQLSHYCEHGWREGASPSPFFDPSYYLHMNPDVAAADCEPLQHYLSFGWRERRNPHPDIDISALLAFMGDGDEEPIGRLFRMRFSPGEHPLLGWSVLRGGTPVRDEVRPRVATRSLPEITQDELSQVWISGEASPWFDERWYLAQYPEVLQSELKAFDHYRAIGWKENKWPNALFEPDAYRKAYSDLAEDVEPLDHYIITGRFEGRKPSSIFHAEWFAREWQTAYGEVIEPWRAFFIYLSHPEAGNVSVHPLFDPIWYRMEKGAESVERPLEDYLHNRERFISSHPLVDEQWYHDTFLRNDQGAALKHYLEYGHAWGWTTHPVFDEAFYKASNQCEIPGAEHYLIYGESRGARPNAFFSPFYYKATFHHLDGAEQSPLTHFVKTGDAQGLSPSPEFNAKIYRSRHLSFSREWRAMRHFMMKGRYEGIEAPSQAHPLPIGQWLKTREPATNSLPTESVDRTRIKVIAMSPSSPFLEEELGQSDIYQVVSIVYLKDCEELPTYVESDHKAIDAYLLVDGNVLIARRDLETLVTELMSRQIGSVVPMVVDMEGMVIANNEAVQDAILRPLDKHHPHVNVKRTVVKAAGPLMLVSASTLTPHLKMKPAKAFSKLVQDLGQASCYTPRALALGLNSQPWPCSSHAGPAKKMLYIDSTVPRPDQDAGSDTAFRVLRMLRNEGWEISFLPDADYSHDGRYTEALQDIGVCPYYLPYVRYSAEFIENCEQDFDVVFLARVYSGGSHFDAVKRRWPKARIIFNTVDLHYLREQREAILKNDVEGFSRSVELKKRELELISKADSTIVLSSAELSIIEQENVKGNIFVVPPIFSSDRFVSYDPINRNDIFFLGGYAHLPNVDAVDFFVKEVWPLVLKERTDITFHIAGANPPAHFKDYESDTISLVGYIEDLDDFLGKMRINVAPLRYGAGVKVKVIAGLASGVPCIGTSVAIEGTGIDDGYGVVVANDPKEMANTIIELYDDVDRLAMLSENGRKMVNDNYSIESVKGLYQTILMTQRT